MEIKEFIEKFNKEDENGRWGLVIDNQDLGIIVNVDNDDISITFEDDEDEYVSFGEFGYDALVTLLNNINVKADYV